MDNPRITHPYNSLGRLTQQGGTSYAYNGDGVLVERGGTSYTQDLVAPLEQVLNDGTTNLVYGHTRMTSGTGTWYQHDGLGSVRAVLDASGAVQSTTSYDPWGVPTAGSTDPFGFTGNCTMATWYTYECGGIIRALATLHREIRLRGLIRSFNPRAYGDL